MSGLAVHTIPVPGAATTALLMGHHGGARFEAPGEAGFAHFLEHLILRRGRASGGIAGTRALESLGAEVGAETTHDLVTFHVRCRARDAPAALGELAALLARPLASEADVARERDVVLSELAEHSAKSAFSADVAAGMTAFGGHPLGRSVLGDPQAFSAASIPRLADFRERWWSGSRSALIAVGATTALPQSHAIRELFADAAPATRSAPPFVAPRLLGGTTSIAGGPGLRQLRVVCLALVRAAPLRLRCAMAVLDRLLTSGGSGLLRLLARRHSGGAWVAIDNATAAHADCLTMRVSAAGPQLDALGLGEHTAALLSDLDVVPDLEARVARARSGTLGQMTLGIDTPLAMAQIAASRVLLFDEEPEREQLLDELAAITVDDIAEVAALLTEQLPCVLAVGVPDRPREGQN